MAYGGVIYFVLLLVNFPPKHSMMNVAAGIVGKRNESAELQQFERNLTHYQNFAKNDRVVRDVNDTAVCPCTPPAGRCTQGTSSCLCDIYYTGTACELCHTGYYGHPNCKPCDCDTTGTVNTVCNSVTGQCICKENYNGDQCSQCADNFYSYPECIPVKVTSKTTSLQSTTDRSGIRERAGHSSQPRALITIIGMLSLVNLERFFIDFIG